MLQASLLGAGAHGCRRLRSTTKGTRWPPRLRASLFRSPFRTPAPPFGKSRRRKTTAELVFAAFLYTNPLLTTQLSDDVELTAMKVVCAVFALKLGRHFQRLHFRKTAVTCFQSALVLGLSVVPLGFGLESGISKKNDGRVSFLILDPRKTRTQGWALTWDGGENEAKAGGARRQLPLHVP